ncbi:keratin-associated protein 16-1-like [Dysidea avara]|uniref:keratin-associated protein 16-1-like n=1 Tax=Dysidea avara TaxID=196820 RepID=UPI0033190C08
MQQQLLLLLVLVAVTSATYYTRRNPCLLDSDVGPCDGLFKRYFFNKRTGQCEQFNYGGCGGNANNFLSKRSCQRRCGGRSCPIQGQVFQRCKTCPATCTNPGLVCTLQCQPGCGCPPGKLIDVTNNRCVQPSQCPVDCSAVLCAIPKCTTGVDTAVPPRECCPQCVCRVGNRTLLPGDTYPLDCNTCTCTKNGLVACTEKACLPADPCESVTCPTGSQCEVFEPTGETFCNPSCDLDNGGCPTGQTCSLQQVQCVRAPCPPVVQCTDPCASVRCPTGSKCEVYKPTGEVFCNPSCDLDNGGCPTGQTCSLQVVQCVRAPCPPVVQCKCPLEGQVFTTCGTACPPTCNDPGPVICTLQCVVGCQCPSGTVLDEKNRKCVKPDQCECPPTCSPHFCNNPRNRYRPCSRPPPLTVPPCPDMCRTTYCNACYYSDTALPTPSRCNNLCHFPPSLKCLRSWASCVGHYGNHYWRKSSAFRCYEYTCPLRG